MIAASGSANCEIAANRANTRSSRRILRSEVQKLVVNAMVELVCVEYEAESDAMMHVNNGSITTRLLYATRSLRPEIYNETHRLSHDVTT